MKQLLLATGLFMLCIHTHAQVNDLAYSGSRKMLKAIWLTIDAGDNDDAVREPVKSSKPFFRSYSKINLGGLAFADYAMRYEKSVSKKVSAFVSFRYLPGAALPFASNTVKAATSNPNSFDVIDNFRLSNLAFTPELRIYLNSKGKGEGFYVAPFYRYASFKTRSFLIDIMSDAGRLYSFRLNGNLSSSTAGLMAGAKWSLTKRLFLNWWMLGPHYNSANGVFNGASSRKLSYREQDKLRNELHSINSPLANSRVTVNAQSTCLELGGAWGGLKGGLSVGIKF